MPSLPPPPEAFNLSFDDIKSQVDKVVDALDTAMDFVDRFAWFIPAQYKTSLEELHKIVQWVNSALDKTP